jgi:hypothetical protein
VPFIFQFPATSGFTPGVILLVLPSVFSGIQLFPTAIAHPARLTNGGATEFSKVDIRVAQKTVAPAVSTRLKIRRFSLLQVLSSHRLVFIAVG